MNLGVIRSIIQAHVKQTKTKTGQLRRRYGRRFDLSAGLALLMTFWLVAPHSTQAVGSLEPANILESDLKKFSPLKSLPQIDASHDQDACAGLTHWRNHKVHLYLTRQRDLETVFAASNLYLEHQDEMLKKISKAFHGNTQLKSRVQGLLKQARQNQFNRFDLSAQKKELSKTDKSFYVDQVVPVRVGLQTLVSKTLESEYGGWFDRWTLHQDSSTEGRLPYLAMAEKVEQDAKSDLYQLLVKAHKATLIRDMKDSGNHFERDLQFKISQDDIQVVTCTQRKYWEMEGVERRNPLEEKGLHQRYQAMCSSLSLLTGKFQSDFNDSQSLSLNDFQQVEDQLAVRCWKSISDSEES